MHLIKKCSGGRGKRAARDEHEAVANFRLRSRELREQIHAGHLRHHEVAWNRIEVLSAEEQRQGFFAVGNERHMVVGGLG